MTDGAQHRQEELRPEIAERQAGVFTARQAVQAGWTPRQVERRLASGRWHRLAGKGLLALPRSTTATLWQVGWAVILTHPDAVIGGPLAARLHDMPVPNDGRADVYGRPGRGHNSLGVIRIATHSPPVPPGEVWRIGALPVTDPHRTAIDCLALMNWDDALNLYAWLTTRGRLDHAVLCAQVRARLDRPGNTQLRRLAAFTRHGAVSAPEHLLHQGLRTAGVVGWQASVQVSDHIGVIGVVDLLFAAARLVVEVDGLAAHSGRHAFQRDRLRQNRLVNAGYRVLRFTWWDVTERREFVVQQIVDALSM